MKTLKITCLLLFLFISNMFPQGSIVIKGKVIEQGSSVSLIGVTVVEVNENSRVLNGTVTDVNGNFTLKVSNINAKLKVSYVGYKTKERTLDGSSFLTIPLEIETQVLEEVVVKGEGKKVGGLNPLTSRDLTSSVESINMSELEDVKVSNIGEALQGRAGNVDITMASGDPGAGMSIRIRGTSSISGSNEPLIVVDGVPFEIQLDNDFDFTGLHSSNSAAS